LRTNAGRSRAEAKFPPGSEPHAAPLRRMNPLTPLQGRYERSR
jgi:hypothetical protein